MALSRREKVRLELDPVFVCIADGLYAAAMEIGQDASDRVTDAPPKGDPFEDWHKKYAAAAWALGKKVAGSADKPRKMRTTRSGANAIVGFPFPGRLYETGTVHMPPRPFFSPAAFGYLTSARFPQVLAEHFVDGNVPGPKA